MNATNLSLRRGSMPDQPFAGHWQETYVIPRSTAVGWPDCTPNPMGDVRFDLQLTQNGNTVSGTVISVPFSSATPLLVNGTISADGASVVLTGSRTEPVSSATYVVRLTGWSTTRDAIGRLQGTFSYIVEVHWTSGPEQGRIFSTSYDAELRYVVRVPW